MQKLGLVSVSFRNLSPKTIIEEAKNAGLSCIEWGSDIHAPYNDTVKLNKIAKMQKEAGLYCCSYGTYFRLGKDDTDELQKYINAAKILGTDILRLWCGTKASIEYSDKEIEALFAECKKAAEIAEKNGVVLCMECHNNTLTDDKDFAIKLIKNISSPAFRMYWQPNQYKTEEENKEYARLLSSFTKNIHVFNWKGDKRFPLKNAVSLWKEYLSFFTDEKTLLLEFMPDDDIKTLYEEVQALKQIVSAE
ncbi:MAG: TIM barrel protein [Clostridia bacterium]|nr:TIM barrel protein [Clostridia bacterium]